MGRTGWDGAWVRGAAHWLCTDVRETSPVRTVCSIRNNNPAMWLQVPYSLKLWQRHMSMSKLKKLDCEYPITCSGEQWDWAERKLNTIRFFYLPCWTWESRTRDRKVSGSKLTYAIKEGMARKLVGIARWNAHWAKPSPLFAHRAHPTPLKCKNEYPVLPLGEDTAVKAVVGSIVWAFRRFKKPRCQEMSAPGYALHSVCPNFPFFHHWSPSVSEWMRMNSEQ